MNTYLYRKKKIKSLFSKKSNTFRASLEKKKSFEVETLPVPFLKSRASKEVTSRTAKRASLPLPPDYPRAHGRVATAGLNARELWERDWAFPGRSSPMRHRNKFTVRAWD